MTSNNDDNQHFQNYSYFPVEEYRHRYEKASELMEKYNIDLLLITCRENINYFIGYDTGLYNIGDKYFHCFGVLPRDARLKPAFLIREGNEGTASSVWVQDKRFWKCSKGEYGGAPYIDMLIEVLKEKGLSNAKIGLELDPGMGLRYGIFKDLSENLKDHSFIDSSLLIWELRKVKSELEVDTIKKACDITCSGYLEGFSAIKEGISEKYIASTIGARMMKEGADTFGSGVIMIYSGSERETWCDALPSDYELKKGDLLQIDGGCTFRGYKSDIMRMAVIGKPSEQQKTNYEIAKEAYQAGLEIVKEGTRCDEVWKEGAKVWSKHGYIDFVNNRKQSNWCIDGHSIGLDIHEPPYISLVEPEVLKSGMVITIEFFNTHNGTWPLRDAKWWYVIVNMIVVRKDGAEVLSNKMKNDLWIA